MSSLVWTTRRGETCVEDPALVSSGGNTKYKLIRHTNSSIHSGVFNVASSIFCYKRATYGLGRVILADRDEV